MKRILYILTAAAIVLTGCTKELPWEGNDPALEERDSVYPEGAQVDLLFSVPAPIVTKGAMADKPVIDNLFVAIFDGSGTLKEYVEATPLDGTTYVSENGIEGRQRFKARVTLKNSERRLHFIANGPEKDDVTGGMESTLLQQWMTQYPNGAYWQRIVLPNGITAYTFSDKKSDGTPWAAGDRVYYYYTVSEEGGKEVYTPVSSTTPGREVADYVIVMVNGRPTYTAGNMTVNPGDFVNAKGEKIVDGTGFFQSDEVAGAVNYVPMVRNFARIKIVPETVAQGGTAEGNFVPVEFYLMNIPDRGTIAPYSTAVGGFVPQFSSRSSFDTDGNLVVTDPDIAQVEAGDKTYDALLTSLNNGRYPASIPSGGTLIQTVDEVKSGNAIPSTWKKYTVAGTLAGTESAFLFERGLPNKNQDPTYLLIRGNLTVNGTAYDRWFKVELTDKNGKYERIFRGVTYALEISKITGSEGYDTAVKAALGTPVSDVSNSTATENLLQVNDGKGTSMWVEYIDYVGVRADGESKRILYKVFDSDGNALAPTWDDDGDASTPAVSRYTLTCDPEATAQTDGAVTAVTEDAAYSGSDTPDGKNDWRIATVTLRGATTENYESTLTIAGVTADGASSGSGKTLSRKVKYHAMGTQTLTLSATPLASEAAGKETALTIHLPKLLGFSMFPLTLMIEAEKANLNPVASENKYPGSNLPIDLPVETGTSYFSNQNTFYYLFTINYSDYYNRENTENPYIQDFTLYFTTSKDYSAAGANGSNATFISVTDRYGYFYGQPEHPEDMYTSANKAVTELTVTGGGNGYFNVSPASQTVKPSDASATFSISTNSGNGWTVSSTTSGVTFSTNSGTGNGVVTANIGENDTNTSRTINVTVTPTTGTAKTITITQAAPTVSLASTTASVPASATGYAFNVSSNTTWTAEVVSGGSDVALVTTKATSGEWTGDGMVQLSFNANESTSSSRTIQVKVYVKAYPTISTTLTLTQKREPVTGTLDISTLNTNTYSHSQTVGNGTVAFTNTKKNNNNLTLGYRADSGNNKNRPATIKITPTSGATITKLVITFSSSQDAGYAVSTDYSAPAGWTYSTDGSTITWTGESSGDITWTIGHDGNNGWPVATAMTVTYE